MVIPGQRLTPVNRPSDLYQALWRVGVSEIGENMREVYSRPLIGMAVLLITQLACRPLITVGWQEMAIFFVIAAVAVVPLLLSLYRLLSRFKGHWETSGEKRGKRE